MPNNRTCMNDLVVVEKLSNWQRLKALVLDSVSSPLTRRVYNMALDDFVAWFQEAPRPGFSKSNSERLASIPRSSWPPLLIDSRCGYRQSISWPSRQWTTRTRVGGWHH